MSTGPFDECQNDIDKVNGVMLNLTAITYSARPMFDKRNALLHELTESSESVRSGLITEKSYLKVGVLRTSAPFFATSMPLELLW